jgi:hypothetical protein
MDGSEEGSAVFGVARGNSTPSFQVQEGILNQMPQLIQVAIVLALYLAAAAGWYDRFHALPACLGQDRVRVVASVSQQILRCKPFN